MELLPDWLCLYYSPGGGKGQEKNCPVRTKTHLVHKMCCKQNPYRASDALTIQI